MIDESGQSPNLDDDLFFSEEQPEQAKVSNDLPPGKSSLQMIRKKSTV